MHKKTVADHPIPCLFFSWTTKDTCLAQLPFFTSRCIYSRQLASEIGFPFQFFSSSMLPSRPPFAAGHRVWDQTGAQPQESINHNRTSGTSIMTTKASWICFSVVHRRVVWIFRLTTESAASCLGFRSVHESLVWTFRCASRCAPVGRPAKP